jgi:hypothetical protein
LVNNGLGPAIIKDFKVELKGTNLISENGQDIETILENVIPANSHIHNYNTHICTIAPGYTMAQNESKEILRIEYNKKNSNYLLEKAMNLIFTVRYEFFYGEKETFRTEEKHLTNK